MAEFYSARGWGIPPLPWTNLSPPFSSLACTNAIENAIGTVRTVQRNVQRWRNAEMALRWTAASLLEAQKTFRRLKAYRQLPVLDAALREAVRKAGAKSVIEDIEVAA